MVSLVTTGVGWFIGAGIVKPGALPLLLFAATVGSAGVGDGMKGRCSLADDGALVIGGTLGTGAKPPPLLLPAGGLAPPTIGIGAKPLLVLVEVIGLFWATFGALEPLGGV